MSNSINLLYQTPYGDISQVIKDLSKFWDVQTSVIEKFGTTILCDVERPYAGGENPDMCFVRLASRTEEHKTKLDNALWQYLTGAGLPRIIGNGSDYGCCDRVLKSFGKRTKWKFWGGMYGRSIVDL